jgi:hypothetical protein
MIWIVELIVLLVFVGFGGFEGFIAWSVLTALIMFARHSSNQTKLKAAELSLQAERAKQDMQLAPAPAPSGSTAGDPPPHTWVDDAGSRVDFRTMMWGSSYMVRRVSAAQWEIKCEPDLRTKHIASHRALLAQPAVAGPAYEPCAECGTHGSIDLHRPSCSKYNEADEVAARARDEDENMRSDVEDSGT